MNVRVFLEMTRSGVVYVRKVLEEAGFEVLTVYVSASTNLAPSIRISFWRNGRLVDRDFRSADEFEQFLSKRRDVLFRKFAA